MKSDCNKTLSSHNAIYKSSFIRFLMVGVINTIVGTTVMFLAYNVIHLNYWTSSALNYIVGSILSFYLNKRFTFHSKSSTSKSAIRFVVHISICYLIAYGIAKPLMEWTLSGATKALQENVALLVGMVLFVILNYIGQLLFVFKSHNK